MLQKKEKIGWIFLFFAASVVVIVGLFQHVIGDASLYASISKRMFNHGDYLNLYLIDRPYVQKPHLVFWLSSFSFALFGVNTFAFKLPSVLIALSGVYGVYLIGKSSFNSSVGKLSAILWFFSLAYLLHSNDIHMDTMMSAFIIFCVLLWYKYVTGQGVHFLFLGCIPLAMAMMTKGPMGGFVPISGLIAAILYQKGVKKLFIWQHIVAIFFLIVLISPVLYAIYQQHGFEGLKFYFWDNNVGRVNRESGGDKDYIFYIHTILWFFLPWSILSLIALGKQFDDLFKRKLSVGSVFFLSCFSIFLIIASFADGRAPHYCFVLLPFLAILTANYLYSDTHVKMKKVVLLIPLCLILIASIILSVIFPPKNGLILLVLVLLMVSGFFFLKIKKPIYRLVCLNAVAITMLFAVINIQIFRNFLMPLDAIANASLYYNEHAQGEEKLYVFDGNDHHPSRADFYSKNEIIRPTDLKNVLTQPEHFWLLVNEQTKEEIGKIRIPKKQYKFSYLLLTRPYRSIKAYWQNDESGYDTYYLLYY